MTDIADRYRRNAAAFTEKVAAVPPDRWSDPSPCEGWDARDVVRHVVDTQGMFLGFVGRELGDIPSVDDDPLAAWEAARDAVQADLDDPDRAGVEFDGFTGRATFAEAVDRFLASDLPIHGWDLARATGGDEVIDPAEVERGLVSYPQFAELLRSPGVCKPPVESAPDADDQTRLLNFLGRET
jgi:uncharacterized protein (TIGR03086 family)